MFYDLYDRIRASRILSVAVLVIVIGLLAAGAYAAFATDDAAPDAGVVVNDDGSVTVANRDQLDFMLSFDIPQNCAETTAALTDLTAQPAGDDTTVRDQVIVFSTIGEELCSYRDWMEFRTATLDPWYSSGITDVLDDTTDSTAPTSTP
jgi:hypothetical protein